MMPASFSRKLILWLRRWNDGLYNLSHIFVVAFNGIFNDQALGRSVFEISTIVAMIVYALIAWGIVSLCRVIFAPNLPGRQSVTTTRRRRV